jgi:hypothetical protein
MQPHQFQHAERVTSGVKRCSDRRVREPIWSDLVSACGERGCEAENVYKFSNCKKRAVATDIPHTMHIQFAHQG